MKIQILILLLIVIPVFIFAQENTCDSASSEDDFMALNTISLSKCNAEEESNELKTRTVTTNITSKKKNNRIAHYVRKNNTKVSVNSYKSTCLLYTSPSPRDA